MRFAPRVILAAAMLTVCRSQAADYFDREGLAFRVTQQDWSAVTLIVEGAEKKYAAKPDLENSVSLARVHALTGKHEEAISLLLSLEEQYPDEPAIAAGLAAAFELSGKDEDAMEWIRELAARDPTAHRSSAWLHIQILEAKVALAQDPNWLQDHSVLGLSFGDEAHPQLPADSFTDENGREISTMQVRLGLAEQLKLHRNVFPAPKSLLGDLYMAAADIQLAEKDPVNSPAWHYDCAIELGAPRADLAKLRRDTFVAEHPGISIAKTPMQYKCGYEAPRPYGAWARAPAGLITLITVIAGFFFLQWARRKYR